MPTLAGFRADRVTPNWNYFIRDNPKWRSLKLPIEITKSVTTGRALPKVPGLTDNGKKVRKWLKTGDKVELVSNQLRTIETRQYAKTTSGLVEIRYIRKPTSGSREKIETKEITSIRSYIQDLGFPVTIKTYDNQKRLVSTGEHVIDVQKIHGTPEPKADFALFDRKGQPVVWISHKGGQTAKDFLQYGGISRRDAPKTHRHPETQQFLVDLLEFVDEKGAPGTPVYRPIRDQRLAALAVFGGDWTGSARFGKNSVHIVGQGRAIFTPEDEETVALQWSAHSTGFQNISEIMRDRQYKPVFFARKASGRAWEVGGRRMIGARIGIFPWGHVITRSGLQEI